MRLKGWKQVDGWPLAEEKTLLGGFSILLVVLFGYLGFSLVEIETLVDNSQRIAQTYQRVNALTKLLSILQDAETGQRGYLLTGTPNYLEPYQSAITQVNVQLRQLDELAAGHPDEQRLLSTLSLRIGSKLEEMAQTIQLRQAQGLEAALRVVVSDKGKVLMDEIRRLVADLEQQAHQERQHAEVNARAGARQAHFSVFLIGLLAIVMFVLFSFQVYRSLAARTTLLANEQKSRAQAEAANQAEQEMRAAADQLCPC